MKRDATKDLGIFQSSLNLERRDGVKKKEELKGIKIKNKKTC